jgi:hypothetical protein
MNEEDYSYSRNVSIPGTQFGRQFDRASIEDLEKAKGPDGPHIRAANLIDEMRAQATKDLDELAGQRRAYLEHLANIDEAMRRWMGFLGQDPNDLPYIHEEIRGNSENAPGQDTRR